MVVSHGCEFCQSVSSAQCSDLTWGVGFFPALQIHLAATILNVYVDMTSKKEQRDNWWFGPALHWKPSGGDVRCSLPSIFNKTRAKQLNKSHFAPSVGTEFPDYFKQFNLPNEELSQTEYCNILQECLSMTQLKRLREEFNRRVALSWNQQKKNILEAKRAYLEMMGQSTAAPFLDLATL